MTAPRDSARETPRWYARPAVVLPGVAVLMVFSALMTPQLNSGRAGDPRVSTYSTSPMGGRMFYETVQRLGWGAERSKLPDLPGDSATIVAELDPVVPLRALEVHALLERVRRGGGLLVLLGGGSALLADSLHIAIGDGRLRISPRSEETVGCPRVSRLPLSRRFMYTIWPGDGVTLNTVTWTGPRPDSLVPFVETDPRSAERAHPRPAAVGFPYGRGRIVAGADPDLLRNDAIRNCTYGLDVGAVRMLEYLGDGGARRRIVFDEYHQGYGEQRGTMGAVATYLVGAASGRLLLTLLAAGLVLLLAAAPRLVPPRDPERIERRSPLEHVDALGRAYAQVGATRSATARLVRGLRRRLAGGAVRPVADVSDDAFLDRAARDVPQSGDDVAIIRKALHAQLSRREFVAVGAALERLELSLTRI